MRTVEVNKERLLETLKDNQTKHRERFLKAQEVFREKVIEQLDARLQEARSGGKIDIMFRLPEPRDYTSEYDTAISMVEWAEGDTIELDENDFEQYVLDKWGWHGTFMASTAAYVGGDDG